MTARTNQQTLDALASVKSGTKVTEAAKQFKVHRSSIWRALQRELKKQQSKESSKQDNQ